MLDRILASLGSTMRCLGLVLALLLGLIVPAHAGPPRIDASPDVVRPTPAVQPSPVVQAFLVAYRAHGPPSGEFFCALVRTSIRSAGGNEDGWAVDVEVTDGYLTLGADAAALNPELCFIEVGPPGSSVDDTLRTKLAGIITRASNRTAGAPYLHPLTPRTYAYGGDYIDAPLAMRAGSGASAATYFIHSNSLYSPQVVTNETGQVVERYSYTAFGERTVLGGYSSSTSRIGFNHGFTGLRDEGGLLFARNRYFSPELGRFISRDPAGYVDGTSLYAGYFAPSGMDPTGLAAQCSEDTGPDIDPDALATFTTYTDASMSGVFEPQASVFASARTAYRYMGYSESEAWDAAMDWHDISAYAGGEALNPSFFFGDSYQQQRDMLVNRGMIAHNMEVARQNQLEVVNQMYNMAIDESASMIMMSFGGGLTAGMMKGEELLFSGAFSVAGKAFSGVARAGRMAGGIWKARGVASIAGKARILRNAGYSPGSARWLMEGSWVCFVAGTQIPVEDGDTRSIESIHPGDRVLSKDPATGAEDYKPVVRTFVTHPVDLVHVTFDSGVTTHSGNHGAEIIGTPEHPVWKVNAGWVNLGSLIVGDVVSSSDGKTTHVEKTWREHAPEGQTFTTYNFEVADWHTYFVQAGKEAVWVHNTCTSNRLAYVGRTPGKNSATGRAVIARMRAAGDIMDDPVRGVVFKDSKGGLRPIAEADMTHLEDAVKWWNREGRGYGAKSPEVRKWMLDANNYTLDYFRLNRSSGAGLGIGYLPP